MILTRWWKRNTQPTLDDLKKVIENEVLGIDITTPHCDQLEHSEYLKEYLWKTDQDLTPMCTKCLQNHKEGEEFGDVMTVKQYKNEIIRKFGQIYSSLQNARQQDDKFAKISLTQTIDSRSKVFDFYQQILKNGEQINKSIHSQFPKIQQRVKDSMYVTLTKMAQEKMSTLDNLCQSQKYLKQLEEILHQYKTEKTDFSLQKSIQFKHLLNQVVQKMISNLISLGNGREKQTKENPEIEQWQENAKLQEYISTLVQQMRLMRLDVDVLIKQNNTLNFEITQFDQELKTQRAKNDVLESRIQIMNDDLKGKLQEIHQYQEDLLKLENQHIEGINKLKKQIELESMEKSKYYQMFISQSDEIGEKKEEVEKMSEYINELKSFYEGKRKSHKTQLITTQNYQIKLQNEFLQLQVEYDQISKQLESALRTINLLEQLNQELKSRILQEESPLRKSLSSTQLNLDIKEKSRVLGDLHSQFITKFQKFWITEEIQQYLKRKTQFRHLFTSEEQDLDNQLAIKYVEQCSNYLILAKTSNDIIFGWLTPSLSSNQNQLFLNANRRRTFEWNRTGGFNSKVLGLQGNDGFNLQGNQIVSSNPQLISRAFDLKGEHGSVQLLRYEVHQVI